MSMIDVIVTTPKNQMAAAAREAKDCQRQVGAIYFRKVPFIPKGCEIGSKCFYVEDGYVRGYAVIKQIIKNGHYVCNTTGTDWGFGCYLIMPADSWTWIRPIPMRGFQGVRSFLAPYEVVGGWLEKKP